MRAAASYTPRRSGASPFTRKRWRTHTRRSHPRRRPAFGAAAIAAILAVSALAVSAPRAVAETTLTVTSQYGPGRPQTVFWEDFRDHVEAALPGIYTFRIVTGGALGGEKEEAEAVRLGAITGALSTMANMTTWVPLGSVFDLPFVFEDTAHIARTLGGPLGDDLKVAFADEGFTVPAFIVFGARHLLSDRPLETPDALSGLTLRALQSDLHIAFWRSLGANPVALPITEAYGALARGVVDGMDMTKSGYDALKLFEVAPVMTETAHIVAVGVVYFSESFWDGLPADHRTVFQDAATRAAAAFNENAAAEQAEALARTLAAGARTVAVDAGPWRAATRGFVDTYVAGEEPALAEALAAIRGAGSAEQ